MDGGDTGARGVRSARPYNHHSLLKTLEAGFGMECLNHACDPRVEVMSDRRRPASHATLECPKGRIQVTEGSRFHPGAEFMGFDLVKWLDDQLGASAGYSAWMPDSATTLCQRATSLRMRSRNFSGVPPAGAAASL